MVGLLGADFCGAFTESAATAEPGAKRAGYAT